jgi:hypothetical protein
MVFHQPKVAGRSRVVLCVSFFLCDSASIDRPYRQFDYAPLPVGLPLAVRSDGFGCAVLSTIKQQAGVQGYRRGRATTASINRA